MSNSELDDDWEPNWPELIHDTGQNPGQHAAIMGVSQLRSARVLDKRSKEITAAIDKHTENVSELTKSLDSFNKATNTVYQDTKQSIDEIGGKLAAFIDAVKNESAAGAQLTREIISENKWLGRWTLLLAIGTTVLAAMTAWMAQSTADLAKQGQQTHDKEIDQITADRELLKQERSKLDQEWQTFKKEKRSWEAKHISTTSMGQP